MHDKQHLNSMRNIKCAVASAGVTGVGVVASAGAAASAGVAGVGAAASAGVAGVLLPLLVLLGFCCC